MLRAVGFVLLALGVSPAAAQSTPPSTDPTSPAAAVVGYRIGSQDLLRIDVLELPDLKVDRRVDTEGKIRLPVLGEVMVAGKTPSELSAELQATLVASGVRRASVDVQVLEFKSRAVSVLGAVVRPGEYNFATDFTLVEALTAAGGLQPAHGGKMYVMRRAGNGLSDRVEIPVTPLVSGTGPEYNLPLQSGDVINVELAESVEIFVLGQATQKGSVKFDASDRVTLLFAIARMGGLPDTASSKITIRRRDANGRMLEIPVNFKRVLSGQDPDVDLIDGDILIVKESFF
ncbi:MAG TPA: polysaccharide biosynthesis/export family protein [Thermoanaerobaculia bacterium]|nr:polysaccharide biosynthesis/export family protein [Thermoanaerobaculia bacterium]